jgi:hypothetical protein
MKNQMNENLLMEVSRMKEMMGIVNEAVPGPRNIRPVLEGILEILGFSKTEIKAEARLASEGILEKFESTIRQSNNGQGSIMGSIDDIAKKLANSATEAEGKVALRNFMRKPGIYETFIDHLKAADPLKFQLKANNVVETKLNLLGADTDGVSLASKILKKFKDDNEGLWNYMKTKNGVSAKLEVWFKNYSGEIVGGIEKVNFIETFLKGLSSDKAATWVTIFKKTFTPAKKLQEEFIALSKGAEEKIKARKDASEEFKKMGDILLSTKKWFDDLPKNVYDGSPGNPGWKNYIDDSVRDAIEKDKNGFKKLYDQALEKQAFFEPIKIEMRAYAKAWPFRLPYKSNSVSGKFIFKSWDKDFILRWMNLLIIRDPRRFDEMYSALLARGSKGSLFANTVGRLTIDALIAPAFITAVYETGKLGSSWVEGITNFTLKMVGSDTRFNWVEYDSKPDESYIEKLARNFIEDYLSLLPHNLKEFLDPLKQTYLDELVQVLNTAVGGGEVLDNLNTKNIKEQLKNNTQKFIDEHPELKECGLLPTDTMDQIVEKVTKCKNLSNNPTPSDTTSLPAPPTDPNAVSEEITNAEVDAFIDANLVDLKDLIVKPYTVNSDKTVTLYLSGQNSPFSILFKVGGKITIKNSN